MDLKLQKLQNLFNDFAGITKSVQVLCDARKYSSVSQITTQLKESTFNFNESRLESTFNFNESRLESTLNGNRLDQSQVKTLDLPFNGISLVGSRVNNLESTFNGSRLDCIPVNNLESAFKGSRLDYSYNPSVPMNNDNAVVTVNWRKDATFNESRLNQILFNNIMHETHDVYDSQSGVSEYHSHPEYGNEDISREIAQQKHPQLTESIVPSFSAGSIDQSSDVDKFEPEQIISNIDDGPDDLNFLNVKSRNGCDITKMHVPTSDQGKYKKKLCCVYCLKRYAKLARHLESIHKNEPDVKRFRTLAKGSKQRRAIIDKLRKLGQFEWNHNSKINKNELSTSRRPNQKYGRRAVFYKTCAKCRGIYSSNGLRYHWRRCTKYCLVGERIVRQLSRAVEGRLHEDAFDDLRTIIFPKMQEDEEVLTIRYDWIVITYGNDLCLNYSPHYQHAMIRTKLRNAGKLLLASKKIRADITDFASIYHVRNCDTVIKAIRVIAKFDAKLKAFESPGTAAALVTLINTIGELLIIESMKAEDEDKEKIVERFLKVFQKDAKLKINKIVTMNQLKRRREKIENIPNTDDVCKLATFLDREREICFAELTETYSFENWQYLAQLTMMSVLVFNRKRVGDTQNILVGDFNRREIITERCDASPRKTRHTIKSRITTRGKLYRTVPVLLKHNFDDCLELILSYREHVGVPDTNDFLFGLPSKSGDIKVIDAGVLFRKYSELCGAENPSSLRGTNLRKHFASICATMNLSDNDVTNVAKFLGHSDSVHRNIYRQNPLHQELKISTYLDFAQGKSNIDTMSASDIAGSSVPNTKRKRTKEMTNVIVNKKARKQTEKTQRGQSYPDAKQKQTKKMTKVIVPKKDPKPQRKATKKKGAVNVVGKKNLQKQIKK